MAISDNTAQNENEKFIESTRTAGQPVVAVSNEDGSPIGVPAGAGSIVGGTLTIDLVLTPEALATSTACKSVMVQADKDNTGIVYIGGSAVVTATENGIALRAEDAITIPIDNLSKVFAAVSVAGEKVNFVYVV